MTKALRLQAITARGLGSYLRGARLELGELTILCGTNGSGKSTWLRLLDVLKASAVPGCLPYQWKNDLELDVSEAETVDEEVRERNKYPNHKLTTSIFDESEWGDPDHMGFKVDQGPPGDDERFGPIGTVGLELLAASELRLPSAGRFEGADTGASVGERLVWSGICPAGTKLTVRFTDPTQEMFDDVFRRGFELRVGAAGEEFVKFEREPRGAGKEKTTSEPGYAVTCSPKFFPGIDSSSPLVFVVGTGRGKDGQHTLRGPHSGSARVRAFVDAVETCVVDLVHAALAGYFHVSDIRTRHRLLLLSKAEYGDDATVEARYVGRTGQHTHLLERRFAEAEMRARAEAPQPSGYIVRTFYSEWLRRLVGVGVRDTTGTRGDMPAWNASGGPPTGHVASLVPPPPLPDDAHSGSGSREPRSLERYEMSEEPEGGNPRMAPFPAWKGAAPANMSSGFHQIAPLIMQTALAQPNEIVGVENPEVHLHPSLQLKIAEFFLEQLGDGKLFIIETHSDLFVRRVMRAILEEGVEGRTIKQAQVRVWFTRPGEDGFSRLDKLTVDRLGRIDNWPPGFMDDSVRESRRVLDLMYRAGEEPDASGPEGRPPRG